LGWRTGFTWSYSGKIGDLGKKKPKLILVKVVFVSVEKCGKVWSDSDMVHSSWSWSYISSVYWYMAAKGWITIS